MTAGKLRCHYKEHNYVSAGLYIGFVKREWSNYLHDTGVKKRDKDIGDKMDSVIL